MLKTRTAPTKLMKNYNKICDKVQNCTVLTISNTHSSGMKEE